MRGVRIGRFVLLPLIALLVGSVSTAQAQFYTAEPAAPTNTPSPVSGVPAKPLATDPPAKAEPGDTKTGDMTKLYDKCLTCDRPVRFGLFCREKRKGCFQKATIFEWSIGCDPRKNGDEEEAEEEDRLASDRPDFTEASSTVGRGRVQLESGYTYFSDNTRGVRTITHSYPEALFRIGMFADWFELRIGQTFFSQTVTQNGVSVRDGGASDLYLGCKLALTLQKGIMPETALILQGTVPSGVNAFTASRVLYGFNYLFGWDVTECITLGGSFQLNKFVDDNNRSYALFAQSITVGYKLTENLNAYTEWFAFYPTGATDTGGGAQHYYDGGFQYFVTNNFALDIRIGVGLSRSADDFFTGVGFVARY